MTRGQRTAARCPAHPATPHRTWIGLVVLVFSLHLAVAEAPPPPAETLTPRGTVSAFLAAGERGDYDEAARFLNLVGRRPANPEFTGRRLARQLHVVLALAGPQDTTRLSDLPEGNLEDGLPADVEAIATVGGDSLLLERVEMGHGLRVWKVASSTVARVPALYAEFGMGPLGEFLSTPALQVEILRLRLWEWVALALLLVLAHLGSWLMLKLAQPLLRRAARLSETTLDDELLQTFLGPIRMLLALLVMWVGVLLLLQLDPLPYRAVIGVIKALVVIAATWAATRTIDVAESRARQRLTALDRRDALSLLPLGRRSAKIVLLVIAVVASLQNLGVEMTGLVAGLGVGGLAIGLAAQKTVANLFGGISLVADQPVSVGDFCRFADGKTGTVEDIGLRSTRLRTLDRTLITIPNAEFSEVQIENFAARDRIRLQTVLQLRYETTPDQLRFVLAELRRLLLAHPRLTAEPARVRFVGFGAHSLDIEVNTYVATQVWEDFLAVREDVFLRMMDIVVAGGTGFAFPSQTLYMARDGGLDAQRTEESESTVRRWREQNRLPFPGFSPEEIAEVRGTLDYPGHPPGSARPPGA